jgi:hypothetical protein
MGDAVSAQEVADAVYKAIFTNTQKILIPSMVKNYSLINRFLPSLVQKLIEKQGKDIEYHTNVEEDEPEFSYVKCVKCEEKE